MKQSNQQQQECPEIIERLDAVYGKEDNTPDRAIIDYGLAMLCRVEWEE